MIDYTEIRQPDRIAKIKKVLDKRQSDLTVVMENVFDPHNIAACLRSCDAVGIFEVHLINYHNHPWRSKQFRKSGHKSSASARKWLILHEYDTIEDCFAKLRSENKKIYTTGLGQNSVSVYDLNLVQPVAMVFGNEKNGVSEEAVKLADGNFNIPQVGMIQSLNISVACAVSVYEAYRQKSIAKAYESINLNDEIYSNALQKFLE